MEEKLNILLSLGLSEKKANETLKNEAVTKNILLACEEASKRGGNINEFGTLLYHLATKIKPQIQNQLGFLVDYIVGKKLNSTLQVDAALEFLLSHAHENYDLLEFEKECGVGVIVTPEDIELAVEKALATYKDEIYEKRYRFNQGPLLQDIRKALKWADFKNVMNEIDVQLVDMLGPKTDADRLPVIKKSDKTASKPKKIVTNKTISSESAGSISEMISKLNLHKPGENFKSEGYVITDNTKRLLEEHLKITGGQVRTRFPPEPNGILHIGHAKAININFGYAAYNSGICYLRFDDTNPEKEEEKFFKGIIDMVDWLGYKPYKITHSSDYFDQLYLWAVELIKLGQAYVCHQTQEEIQGHDAPPSPYRNRSIQENLTLFQDMKRGKMAEGECTLRMKITLEEGKRDPVAYRIKYVAHPRTGDLWCIYPTYDYTHCLCDSIEHITHSLCTKEFQSRRSSYYWLCNVLNIYCPVQWEYGRLNMNYTVVSKRKIAKLIEMGIVKDWDDPRLFTLSALRRRGFPPEAINKFCAKIGVTGAQSVVDPVMLEACARDVLNITAPRTMVVLEPLEVVIINGINDENSFTIPDFPANPEKGNHTVSFSSTVYIEMADFKPEAEVGYKRLTKNQPVGLRYTPYLIKLANIHNDQNGHINKIEVIAEKVTNSNKPLAFIHWVSKPESVTVRLYNNLFKHKNPEDTSEVPNGFLSDITDDSLKECTAYADKYLISSLKPFQQFQFERTGYFSVDPDTNNQNVIFNRTLLLKEDPSKN